jgi:MFS family permease
MSVRAARSLRPSVARLLLDVSPLRTSREFRLLWSGQVVSQVGSMLTVVAVPYQTYELTGSNAIVGLVSGVTLVPLVLGALWGGAIADAYDRRRILLVTQVLLAACSVGLAVNAASSSPQVWPLFVCSSASAAVLSVDWPTRSALVPSLVGVDALEAALALNSLVFNLAQVVGPALGGLLIDQAGLAAVYVVDAVSFTAVVVQVARMSSHRPARARRPGWAAVREGLGFVRRHRTLQSTFLADINAMVFGMPVALFPALADDVFGGGAATVGWLAAAPAAGAVIGAATTGWITRIERQGRAVIVSIAIWGLAIAAFGFTRSLPLALVLLAIAGAADLVSAVFRNSITQRVASDEMRGRMSSIFIAVVRGGPRLGDLEAGTVAAVTTPQVSVVSGGLACVAGIGVVARLYPELARWTRSSLREEADAATSAGGGGEPARQGAGELGAQVEDGG